MFLLPDPQWAQAARAPGHGSQRGRGARLQHRRGEHQGQAGPRSELRQCPVHEELYLSTRVNLCQNICTYDVLHLSAGCNTAVYIYIYTVSIQSLLSGDKCVFSDLSSTTLLPLIKISWGSTITEKCTMARWCQVLSTMFVDNKSDKIPLVGASYPGMK